MTDKSQCSEQETIKIAVPSPDGNNELHVIHGKKGIPIDGDPEYTTNRMYFGHKGDVLELRAEDARDLAESLELAADALEDHHDVRMPLGDE